MTASPDDSARSTRNHSISDPPGATMSLATDSLVERLGKLGLRCESAPTDRLTSATAALACFPMYMVANVHAWTADRQFKVPVIDFPGSEQIREAFAIGKQEAVLHLDEGHAEALGDLLKSPKHADLVIYEYALETLAQFLAAAAPPVVAMTKVAVATMIVAVAEASGKGLLGSGPKVAPEERECIHRIAADLSLARSEDAAAILQAIG